MSESNNQIKLFISYSHDDSVYFNELSNGLKKVVKNSKKYEWSIWDDTKIHVGTFWDEEIQNNIEDCNVALLLVSIGFMSSNYIREKEFNVFKQKYEEKGILIFPIVFNPCDFNQWEDLSKLQFYKPSGKEYGKAEIEDFTYGDLFKFIETNGTLIPNPNIDRYHINLFNKIESSFTEFLNRRKRETENIVNNIKEGINNNSNIINKLSDFPNPSPLFTGRDKEIHEIKNVAEKHRIIAIEGLGGTGKTQIAAKYINDHVIKTDRVIWLNGSSLNNFDVFVENSGYGDVLKGGKKTNLELFSGFKDLIENDERIIFWDNFNDYEDSSFYDFLSFANQYLKKATIILITKVDPIIEGITSIPSIKIEGLKNDALEYAKKIKSSNKRYEHIPENDLTKICSAVEGHPLAIEFSMLLVSYGKNVDDLIKNMAEFSSIKKVEEFSKRLFFDILDHHKTSKEEKQCFLKCSVFKSKFSIEEVLFIHNNKDVFPLITNLIDKLLITNKDGYYEIHPLIRTFSYERLEEKKSTHEKAADYFISKREDSINISLEEKIFYHLSESENWNEISENIEKNGKQLIKLGQLNLLTDYIKKVESKSVSKPIFDLLMGDICQIKGEWDNALIYFKKASEETINKNIKAEGLVKNGEILFRKGLLEEALLYFENGLEFSIENSLKFEEARALNDIGLIYYEYDKLDIALKNFNASLKIRKEINDIEGITDTNNNIANVYDSKLQHDKAINIHIDNIKIANENGIKISLCLFYINLSNVLRRQKKFDESIEKLNIAYELSKEIGDKESIASCLNSFGLVLNDQGKKSESFQYYLDSLKVREEIGDNRGIAVCYNNIGVYYLSEKKDYKLSLQYLFKSVSMSNKIGIKNAEKTAFDWIKSVFSEIGKTEFIQLSESIKFELGDKIKLTDFMNEPIQRDHKKYNRNDIINVVYENGTISSGKYKKFLLDINNEKCKIIE